MAGGALYRGTGDHLNPGPSRDERRHNDLVAAARRPLRGNYRVGVVGPGGAGKSTITACRGSTFALLRAHQDRVVALDADAGFGELGEKIDPGARDSYQELATDRALFGGTDRGRRSPRSSTGAAIHRLNRDFAVQIIDCGATRDSPLTVEIIRSLAALIVVNSSVAGGLTVAMHTLHWVAEREQGRLLPRTMLVFNDSHAKTDKATRAATRE